MASCVRRRRFPLVATSDSQRLPQDEVAVGPVYETCACVLMRELG